MNVLEALATRAREFNIPVIVGELNALNEEGVMLHIVSAGISQDYFIEGTHDRPLARFVTRSAQYLKGKDWCEHLSAALHRYSDDAVLLDSSFQAGSWQYLGRNQEHYHEFQITFQLMIRRT